MKTTILALVLVCAFAAAQDYQLTPSDSIQAALENAQPGDTIELMDGVYKESFHTVRDGTKENPITIKGSPDAIVKGDGNGRMIQVFHDHIHFKGFTTDGLDGDPDNKNSYTDKLIYVIGQEEKDGVDGFKILNMTIKNSGGEAVRLRYFVTNAEIAHSTFLNTGMHDFKFDDGGKNGEAIYIGTSSNQWDDGKNPTSDPDESTNNWVHNNYIDTQGNECVDIKEGAYNNIVEYNICKGQKDAHSGGLDSRGDSNIFRYNEIYGCTGAGIRIGGHNIDGHQYGQDNHVYNNNIHDNEYGAIKTMVSPQGTICGNVMEDNGPGYGDYQFDQECQDMAHNDTQDNTESNTEDTSNEQTNEETQEYTEPQLSGLQVEKVKATDSDENLCYNTRDSDLDTRWSAEGNGEYIQFDLGQKTQIEKVGIAFYKGDTRIQEFEVQTSKDQDNWDTKFHGYSNGNTPYEQQFQAQADARYVRIVGFGNTENDWNSLTEVRIYKQTEETTDTQETDNDTQDNTNDENTNDTGDEQNNEDTDENTNERIEVKEVTATSDDGNIPQNTIDNDKSTRWSAEGDGQYIQFDLGQKTQIEKVGIAFYKGDTRIQEFEVQTSEDQDNWDTKFHGYSNGNTPYEQQFQAQADARYVRIVGFGNTENDWNSLTEVRIYKTEETTDTQDTSDEQNNEDTNERIEVREVTATSDDGNIPQNTIDNDKSTRWSAEGDGQYIQFDLGQKTQIEEVGIAFYKGDMRVQNFEVQTSEDLKDWKTTAYRSSGRTTGEQRFTAEDIARFVRIVGFGNTENDWNSLTEVRFY